MGEAHYAVAAQDFAGNANPCESVSSDLSVFPGRTATVNRTLNRSTFRLLTRPGKNDTVCAP